VNGPWVAPSHAICDPREDEVDPIAVMPAEAEDQASSWRSMNVTTEAIVSFDASAQGMRIS
jgi:hypothetical protein